MDDDGRAYFGVTAPLPGRRRAATGQREPAGLRQVGALLGDRDAGLLTHAVALANWHATHTHCPRCGALTNLVTGGHSRICPVDGSEHFPRTDPAVIMLVTDAGDRALLARNAPGRSAGSRSWPGSSSRASPPSRRSRARWPRRPGSSSARSATWAASPGRCRRSLMLGFWARAHGAQPIRVDEEEIAEAHWFSRDELRASMAADEIRLPPPVSIAYRIIESWYGDELPAQW